MSSNFDEWAEIYNLKGFTFTKVEHNGNSVVFECEDGTMFFMEHHQSCCEDVELSDIHGELSDLIGSPIISASEDSKNGKEEYGSSTITTYKVATKNGEVDFIWNGRSNGYYSETPGIYKRTPQKTGE